VWLLGFCTGGLSRMDEVGARHDQGHPSCRTRSWMTAVVSMIRFVADVVLGVIARTPVGWSSVRVS